MKNVTASVVRDLLDYDPATGIFRWRVDRRSGRSHARVQARAGDVAGSIRTDGYLAIKIEGRSYRSHRLAWLYVYGRWPDPECDHRNCERNDNRIANLREATRAQNNANSSLRTDNASGLKGVYRRNARWAAQIRMNGALRHLGYFDTAKAAHAAYSAAAAKLRGEFARAA